MQSGVVCTVIDPEGLCTVRRRIGEKDALRFYDIEPLPSSAL